MQVFTNKEFNEAVADVSVGIIVNLPLTFLTLSFGLWIEMSVGTLTIFQLTVFTALAIVRKYYVRTFFKSLEDKE